MWLGQSKMIDQEAEPSKAFRRVRFEPTVNVGSIVSSLVGLTSLCAIIGGYYVLHYRVGQIETKQGQYEVDKRTDREMLVRIDEAIKYIKSLTERRTDSSSGTAAVAGSSAASSLHQQQKVE